MSCTLNFKVLEARGLNEHASSSTVYCVAWIQGDEESVSEKVKHRSYVANKKDESIFASKKVKGTSDANVKFDEETFVFPKRFSRSASQQLHVELWTTGVLNHDLVGALTIPLSSLPANDGQDSWYPLTHPKHDTAAGELRLLVSLIDKKKSTMIFNVKPATQLSLAETIGAEVFESLSPKERKRQEIFFELLNTERMYVRDLEIIHTVFIKGVRDRALLAKNDISTIFSNVEILMSIHQELLQALEEFRGGERNLVKPGLLNIFVQKMNNFKFYTVYASNHLTLPDKLRALKQRNQPFNQFLEECVLVEQCRQMTIDSFLILPLQRICKYPLFFENLVKSTEDPVELESIKTALEQIKEIVTLVNTRTQQEGRIQQMLELQSSIVNGEEYHFLQKDRYIVKQDEATVVFRKEKREAYLFLFNDMLAIAKQVTKEKEKPAYRIQKAFVLTDTVTSASNASQTLRGMADSTEYLQVNPLLLRKWNSQKNVKVTDDGEETKEQEKEREKREDLLHKLRKEKCKFRLMPLDPTEELKDSYYEFVMKTPETCTEWLDDINRLREEQMKLKEETQKNSIFITPSSDNQPEPKAGSNTPLLDQLRATSASNNIKSLNLKSPRGAEHQSTRATLNSATLPRHSRGSLIVGVTRGGQKAKKIASLTEEVELSKTKIKNLEQRLKDMEIMNQQLLKENENFRNEARLLRTEIANRNALFMSDSHDLLYYQLRKGAQTLQTEINSPRIEKKEQEKKEEDKKEKEKESSSSSSCESSSDSDTEKEKEEETEQHQQLPPQPSLDQMFMSGSLALFAQMGQGAQKLLNTPIQEN